MHTLLNFSHSPTISTISHPHTRCPSLPITAHHSPTFRFLLISAGFYSPYSLYMVLYTHRLYAKNDLHVVTYTSMYMYLSLYATHWANFSRRRGWSWPFLLPNCPFEDLWWQDAIEMTSLSCLYSAWKGFSWIWKPQSTLIAIFGWIWKSPSCGHRSPQPDDYGPVLQSWG